MDQPTSQPGTGPDVPFPASTRPLAPGRKRSSSGAGGLFSKLPFMRSTGDYRPRSRREPNETDPAAPMPSLPIPSFITIPADSPDRHDPAAATAPLPHNLQHRASDSQQHQQQKTRRRRGSLRKVALLGRGAQRERRESRGGLTIDTTLDDHRGSGPPVEIIVAGNRAVSASPVPIDGRARSIPLLKRTGDDPSSYGLGISDITPRPSMDGYTILSDPTSDPDSTPTIALAPAVMSLTSEPGKTAADTSPSINYSTTDDEDALHMARSNPTSNPIPLPSISASASHLRPDRASLSSGSESYYLPRPPGPPGSASSLPSLQRRRSTATQRAKSPLALTALAAPLPSPDADWDYAETEWWGWIILLVTWTVFVTGMGSCLGVWSWAWDVGTTPYAPPELEDDPTLPVVGYYPALIILTGVMAWVWVVVAWTGMKYFRHAQVSKD